MPYYILVRWVRTRISYVKHVRTQSGLIQIRKYAEQENLADLLEAFKEISGRTKAVKEELFRLLVGEFGYFG